MKKLQTSTEFLTEISLELGPTIAHGIPNPGPCLLLDILLEKISFFILDVKLKDHYITVLRISKLLPSSFHCIGQPLVTNFHSGCCRAVEKIFFTGHMFEAAAFIRNCWESAN